MRKISSTTLWLLIFIALVAVQAYSAFGQAESIEGSWSGVDTLCLNDAGTESCFRREK